MENRFKLLKIFGLIFKIVAWGALVFGLIGAVGILVTGGTPATPRASSIIVLLVGVLYFIIFYTVSQIIEVLLVLLENTKK